MFFSFSFITWDFFLNHITSLSKASCILFFEIVFSSFLAEIIADSFIRFHKSAPENQTVDDAIDLKSTSLFNFLFFE